MIQKSSLRFASHSMTVANQHSANTQTFKPSNTQDEISIQFSGKENPGKKKTFGLLAALLGGSMLAAACAPAEPAVNPDTAPIVFTQHGEPDEIVAMVDNEPENYRKLYGNHPDKILTSTEVLGELNFNELTDYYHALEADRDTESGGETRYFSSYKLEEFAKGRPDGMVVLPKVQDCGVGREFVDGILGRDSNEYVEFEIAQVVPNFDETSIIEGRENHGDYTVYFVDTNGDIIYDKPLFDIHIQNDTLGVSGKPAYLAALSALIGEADKGWWAEGGVTDLIGDGPFDLDTEDCYNVELWFKNALGQVIGHETDIPYPFDAPDKTG